MDNSKAVLMQQVRNMTEQASRTLRAEQYCRSAAFLLLAALALLSGCTRSVTWEEEVPLATGETIWVKRSGTYSLNYNAGSGRLTANEGTVRY